MFGIMRKDHNVSWGQELTLYTFCSWACAEQIALTDDSIHCSFKWSSGTSLLTVSVWALRSTTGLSCVLVQEKTLHPANLKNVWISFGHLLHVAQVVSDTGIDIYNSLIIVLLWQSHVSYFIPFQYYCQIHHKGCHPWRFPAFHDEYNLTIFIQNH